ncbi:MAG TPA: hypothetical protein VKM00_09560 [Luteimonas sp.]|nr:hypothetical protein [Luteimonas sp.]
MALHTQAKFNAPVSIAVAAFAMFASGQIVTAKTLSAPARTPSRPAEQGCVWEKFSDANLHLHAWVQRCDFGARKIDFLASGHSLAIRYSDGGDTPDPVIDVLDLLPRETPEHGIQRLFAARTDKKLAARCVLVPYRDASMKTPNGVRRFTFVPNKAYGKELAAQAKPDDVPDPPCGDWGDAPDGIQYFEAQPASGVAKVLFVRIGQDTPLFDEATLRLK